MSFKESLLRLLKTDTRLLDSEGELMENKIQDLADKIDENLIELLLDNPETRAKFFLKIKDVFVFKTSDFKFYIDENKIDNSYTQYENRIGLTSKGKFLKDSNDVVLDFPYKDCVLEGGQSTEEGTDTYFEWDEKDRHYQEKQAKRKEIFFNNILAKDEIDRLLEPKAFTNAKKYSANGQESIVNFERDENETIKDNLIIKGNNLLALHTLKKEFAGKVKLIYIDPPYNTGGNGDTFIYNNNFKKSSWLTFMYNRLEVAKKLLTPDGGIIVAIDENEQLYLGLLLKEMFKEYETHCITIVHNPRGIQGTNFSYTNEFAFFIIPIGKKTINNRKIKNEEIEWSNLRNWGSESLRSDAKNCFYPILVDRKTLNIHDFGEVCSDNFAPEKREIIIGDFFYIYPMDNNHIQRKWRYSRQSVSDIKHLLRARVKNGQIDIEIGKDFGQYKTVWIDPKYDSNEYGTKIVKELVPNCIFSFPKSLYNVIDCIHSIVANDKEAIILDYHAGSGTTAHAVLELNKIDEGNRKFILIEQMNYVESVTSKRVAKVIENNKIGSFVYLELAKKNQNAIEQIQNCKNYDELVFFFDEMCDKYYLHYNLKVKQFKEEVCKEENFKKLSLNKQKELFIKMLDLNQLYVSVSDMEDQKHNLSADDIAITKDFYQI